MIEPVSFLTAFTLGLFGSSHCLVMCGGIAAAIAGKSGGAGSPLSSALAFNLGRISTYVIAGIAVSLLGMWLQSINELLMQSLRTIASVLLVLMGLYIGQWLNLLTRVEQAGQVLWKRIQPVTSRLISQTGLWQRFSLGLAWGLLPCGLIYSTLSWVAANGKPVAGGIAMLCFGLGTLPALLASSFASTTLTGLLNQSITRKVAGFLLISYGIWTITVLWLP